MSPRWLLGLVLAASLASTVQAQPGSRCTQPSPVGCALTLGEPATARLQSVGEVHLWWLQLAGRQPLRVVLSGAVADYELYIVQPGGRLVGAATSIAGADAVVVVPDAAPGDYLMTVRSPTGVVHVNPYQLLAQRAPGFGPTTLPPATPVPVATAEPTPLVQPTATAVRDPAELRPFAPIRFGTDVVNRELVGEAGRFSYGLTRLIGYTTQTTDEPPAGLRYGDVWLRNGAVVLDNRDGYVWEEGGYDYFAFTLTLERNLPLRPGTYELILYLDGREVQRGSCVIE